MAEENRAARGVTKHTVAELLELLSEAMPQGASFKYEHRDAGFKFEFTKEEPVE